MCNLRKRRSPSSCRAPTADGPDHPRQLKCACFSVLLCFRIHLGDAQVALRRRTSRRFAGVYKRIPGRSLFPQLGRLFRRHPASAGAEPVRFLPPADSSSVIFSYSLHRRATAGADTESSGQTVFRRTQIYSKGARPLIINLNNLVSAPRVSRLPRFFLPGFVRSLALVAVLAVVTGVAVVTGLPVVVVVAVALLFSVYSRFCWFPVLSGCSFKITLFVFIFLAAFLFSLRFFSVSGELRQSALDYVFFLCAVLDKPPQ